MPSMPCRLPALCALVGVIGGAIFGFVRGLHYLPTLPLAIIEGGVLFGVPASGVGLLLVGGWWLARSGRRHLR